MTLEPLYKTTATGATQVYKVSTNDNIITVEQGQLDGAMQTYKTVCEGKNIGKANESTPAEQAEIEAKAKWVKKSKANYSTDINAPVLVQLPMKISTIEKHGKKLKWDEGVYESIKLNGVNITMRLINDEVVATSRGGEPRIVPTQQIADIKAIMALFNTTELAGEQYCHGQHLQDITSAVTKPNELTPELVYFIFDLPEFGDKPFSDRAEMLNIIGQMTNFPYVNTCMSQVIFSEDQAMENRDQYVAAGYEGTVLTNHDSLYIHILDLLLL